MLSSKLEIKSYNVANYIYNDWWKKLFWSTSKNDKITLKTLEKFLLVKETIIQQVVC